jgi:lipopolysaccharide export system protein LptA
MMRAAHARAALAAAALVCALPALAAAQSPAGGPAPAKSPPRATAAPAPTAVAEPKSGFSNGDFTVETDQTNYNLKTGEFSMPHHVKFTRPGTDVVGDKAAGNAQKDAITITGNVVLHQTGPLNELGPSTSHLGNEPSTLTTDALTIDGKKKTYIANGNVVYTQGEKKVTADHGTLDQLNHTLDLSGNVHINQGEQSMTADTVHYNTLTEDVEAHGAPVLIRAPANTPGPPLPTATPGPKKKRR